MRIQRENRTALLQAALEGLACRGFRRGTRDQIAAADAGT